MVLDLIRLPGKNSVVHVPADPARSSPGGIELDRPFVSRIFGSSRSRTSTEGHRWESGGLGPVLLSPSLLP